MKKFEILQEVSKMWQRDMKWANVFGKLALIDLLNTGVPQTFNCKKPVLGKHNKMRYAYTTIYKAQWEISKL